MVNIKLEWIGKESFLEKSSCYRNICLVLLRKPRKSFFGTSSIAYILNSRTFRKQSWLPKRRRPWLDCNLALPEYRYVTLPSETTWSLSAVLVQIFPSPFLLIPFASQCHRATFLIMLVFARGHAVARCATSRKVAGSIPDYVTGIFHLHNPSDRTMALGLTQPLTEMSTRHISWGVKTAGE